MHGMKYQIGYTINYYNGRNVLFTSKLYGGINNKTN